MQRIENEERLIEYLGLLASQLSEIHYELSEIRKKIRY